MIPTMVSSSHNSSREATWRLTLPERIILNDVTLREGIQASNVPLSTRDKVVIAQMLEDAGLTQLQLGYPARSPADRATTTAVKDAGVKCALECICTVAGPQWEDEILQTATSGADILNLALPTSDIRLQSAIGMSRQEALDRAQQAVRLAKSHDRFVAFSPIDTTRTDLSFLKEVLSAVTEAGVDRFYLIDTVGGISPLGMRLLATELKEVSTVPLAAHCHNDLGLALANGLASVESGVEVVDTCVNGMGKRAGNLSLEELVMALILFHDKDPGIKTEHLYGLSTKVAEMTQVPVYDAKPLVGRNAFDFKVDIQLRGATGHVLRGLTSPAMVGHPGSG